MRGGSLHVRAQLVGGRSLMCEGQLDSFTIALTFPDSVTIGVRVACFIQKSFGLFWVVRIWFQLSVFNRRIGPQIGYYTSLAEQQCIRDGEAINAQNDRFAHAHVPQGAIEDLGEVEVVALGLHVAPVVAGGAHRLELLVRRVGEAAVEEVHLLRLKCREGGRLLLDHEPSDLVQVGVGDVEVVGVLFEDPASALLGRGRVQGIRTGADQILRIARMLGRSKPGGLLLKKIFVLRFAGFDPCPIHLIGHALWIEDVLRQDRRAVEVGEAAQPVADRRHAAIEHGRIGDHDNVSAQIGFVIADEIVEVRAADFFFAFDEELDVAGKAARLFQVGLDRLDVHEHLALVVRGTARVNLAVADRRLEWRRGPELERIDRLDVVVAVVEDGRLAWGAKPVAVHHRVARRVNQGDVLHPCRAKRVRGPFGGAPHVGGVLRQRADARDRQVLLQLVDVAIAIDVDEVDDLLHDGSVPPFALLGSRSSVRVRLNTLKRASTEANPSRSTDPHAAAPVPRARASADAPPPFRALVRVARRPGRHRGARRRRRHRARPLAARRRSAR